jgi:hypothetical protein
VRETAILTLRLLAGFAAAPVAATAISVGLLDVFWHAGLMPEGAPPHSIDDVVAVGLGVMILAVLTIGAAMPGVLWLNKRGCLTLGRLLMLGAVVGNLPFVAITGIVIVGGAHTALDARWFSLTGILVRVAMGVVAGAGGAATFWLVGVCGATDGAGRSSLLGT